MIRPSTILLGPELYWTLLFAVVKWISMRNYPSSPQGNANLEKLWYLLPLIAVPLTFAYLRFSTDDRWWMLLRIDIAAMVGIIACELVSTEAIDYHDSRNSGTYAGFMLAVGLTIFLLIGGNVIAMAVWWWRSRN